MLAEAGSAVSAVAEAGVAVSAVVVVVDPGCGKHRFPVSPNLPANLTT